MPSAISYRDGAPDKWGFHVKPADESFKWIKILLESDSKYKAVEPVKKSTDLLKQLGTNAIDVVGAYLRFLWEYTLKDIQKRQGDDFQQIYSLRVVLTVPAMWSPAAKDKTLQAATRAGLPANLTIVTEPEAAALAVLKAKSEQSELNVSIQKSEDPRNANRIQIGDCIVVCDAGGGTVVRSVFSLPSAHQV